MANEKISDIPTHNAAPGGTNIMEMENPTGPASEWCTLVEMLGTLATRIISGIQSRSGTFTLALTDAFTAISLTTTSSVTIPANATVAFPIGTVIIFSAQTFTVCSLVAATGVTFLGSLVLSTSTAKNNAIIIKVAINTWVRGN